jgi:hypothetical protein
VTFEDAFGNTVTTDNSTVTLAVKGRPGLLSGCSQSENAGMITFSNCLIATAGSGYQLTATEAGLTSDTSTPFDVSSGPAAQLQFTREPGGASTAVMPIATQPQVTVEDAAGNTVTTDNSHVILTLPGHPGLPSGCSQSENAGIITFSNCTIDIAGNGYQLTATDGGLTPDTSTSFDVSSGPAAVLAFSTQPATTAGGGLAFTTQPQVTVQDAVGNTVTTDTSTVTLTITVGTPILGGPAALSGCSGSDIAGVTAFTGCKINTAGSGYQLTATDGTLIPDISNPFNVP